MIDDPSIAHLLGRVGVIEDRIRRLVAVRRAADPQPDDPFRGLYLSDEMVDRLLAGVPGIPDWSDASARLAETASRPPTWPRRRAIGCGSACLADAFGLNQIDVDLLRDRARRRPRPAVRAVLRLPQRRRRPAPALGRGRPRAVRGAAHLRRRPGTAHLAGRSSRAGWSSSRTRTGRCPGARCGCPTASSGTCSATTPPDRALDGVLASRRPVRVGRPRAAWRRRSPHGIRLVYLREPATGSGAARRGRGIRGSRPRGAVDSTSTGSAASPTRSRWRGSSPARRGCAASASSPRPVTAEVSAGAASRRSPTRRSRLLFVGDVDLGPGVVPHAPGDGVTSSRPPPRSARSCGGASLGPSAEGLDVTASDRRSSGSGPSRSARGRGRRARRRRSRRSGAITAEHLAAARAPRTVALDRLARRIEPARRLGRPRAAAAARSTALHEIELRARHREQRARRLGHAAGRRPRASAWPRCSPATRAPARRCPPRSSPASSASTCTSSTSPPSSTSTSARPRRTSSASSGRRPASNAVLLFDEADAVFGKRSEVKDAHDRYANVESAYLLQRMESFDGLAILATNLRANIDEAFTRRLDVIVDFPMPDAAQRIARSGTAASARTVRRCRRHRPGVPRPTRSSSPAAASARPPSPPPTSPPPIAARCGMRHCVIAVQREYRKLGRLVVESEFGAFWPRGGRRMTRAARSCTSRCPNGQIGRPLEASRAVQWNRSIVEVRPCTHMSADGVDLEVERRRADCSDARIGGARCAGRGAASGRAARRRACWACSVTPATAR